MTETEPTECSTEFERVYLTAQCPKSDCDWSMGGWVNEMTRDAAVRAHSLYIHKVPREGGRRSK